MKTAVHFPVWTQSYYHKHLQPLEFKSESIFSELYFGNTLKTFSILSVCLITLLLLIRFIWQLVKNEIRPALAMWLMFSAAVIMSMVTYLHSGDFGLLDNIMNVVDIVYVLTITVAIAVWGQHSSKFTPFDMACLGVVVIIIVFWIFTQNHFVTNILIQSILVIAYFPVVKRLIKTRENSESFLIWTGMMIAPALSLLSSKGILATIYSVRAMICIALLLSLMAWVEVRGKGKDRDEGRGTGEKQAVGSGSGQ
jgi:hypothetical protein